MTKNSRINQEHDKKKKITRQNVIKAALTYESEDRDDKVRGKSIAVCVTVIVLLVMLLFRFAYLQFVKGDYYTKKAYAQQNSWRTISAKRGMITDRNGNVLAISVSSCLVNVNQKIIKDNAPNNNVEAYQKKITQGLADILKVDYEQTLKKIQSAGRYKLIAEKLEI